MTVKEQLVENLALRGLTHLQAEEVLDNVIATMNLSSLRHRWNTDSSKYSHEAMTAIWTLLEPATRQYIKTHMPEHYAARMATN